MEKLGAIATYLSLFGALYSALFCLVNENLRFYDENIKDLTGQKDNIKFEGRRKTVDDYFDRFCFFRKTNIYIKWFAILIFTFLVCAVCFHPPFVELMTLFIFRCIIIVGVITISYIIFTACMLKKIKGQINREHQSYLDDCNTPRDASSLSSTDAGNTGILKKP